MKNMNYKKVFVCLILPFLVLVCCVAFCKNTEAESRGDKVDDVAAYESVLICKGDTLWSIAEANLDRPTDAQIRDYVEEIVSLNNISNHQIHTGNYILVPRYVSSQGL